MVAHFVAGYIARTTDDEDVHRPRDYICYPWYPGFEKSRSEKLSLSRSQLFNCIGRSPETAPAVVL